MQNSGITLNLQPLIHSRGIYSHNPFDILGRYKILDKGVQNRGSGASSPLKFLKLCTLFFNLGGSAEAPKAPSHPLSHHRSAPDIQ